MSLRESAASGVKWSTTSQAGRQVMQLATTVMLARLLSPSDFGLMSMAVVVIGFVNLFKDLGTASAVVQRRDPTEGFLSSVFWVNVVFGFLAMAVLFAGAPILASFYREPRLVPILEVLSLTFVISGLSILQQAIFERNLAFRALAKVEISAIVSGSIVGIALALLGAGVWSLVGQALAIATVTTALLWASSAWRPKAIFRWREIRSVSGYSLNFAGFNVLNYVMRNADYLLIGRFLGAQDLGYYTLAYRLLLYPVQNISWVISRVMFPVLSQIQDDNVRIGRVYLRVCGIVAMIAFPIMFGLWALAEPLILTVFGSRWTPVVLLLMILAPVGLIQSIATTVGVIYQVKGRTDWMLYWGIGSSVLVMAAFVTGLPWGILGVAAAYAIVSVILIYPNFAIPFRLIDMRVRELGTVLWRPFVCSSLMLLALLGLKAALPIGLSSGATLGILVSASIFTYALVSWMVNRDQVQQILDTIRVKA